MCLGHVAAEQKSSSVEQEYKLGGCRMCVGFRDKLRNSTTKFHAEIKSMMYLIFQNGILKMSLLK